MDDVDVPSEPVLLASARRDDSVAFEEQTKPWRHTTRIIRRADAHPQIAELKRQAGKDILVFGSRTVWNDLLARGLLDELHLMIGPLVLGAGTPLFDGQSAVGLATRHATSNLQSVGTRPIEARWSNQSNLDLQGGIT